MWYNVCRTVMMRKKLVSKTYLRDVDNKRRL